MKRSVPRGRSVASFVELSRSRAPLHHAPQHPRDSAHLPVEVPVGRPVRAATGRPEVERVVQLIRHRGGQPDGHEPTDEESEDVDRPVGPGQAGADGRVELIEPGTVATERGPAGRRQPAPDVVVDGGVAGLGR